MNNLSSACPNVELVYNNHCYYDPQVIQIHLDVSWNKIDTQPKVSSLPGPGNHQALINQITFLALQHSSMSKNSEIIHNVRQFLSLEHAVMCYCMVNVWY